MNNNRISTKVNKETVLEIKEHLEAIEKKLPFLISLTQDERGYIPQLQRDNEMFVEETIRAAEKHDQVIPYYIDTNEMKKDLELFQQLARIQLMISKLQAKIEDTKQLSGAEALASALVTQNIFQIAGRMGVHGMTALSVRLADLYVNE